MRPPHGYDEVWDRAINGMLTAQQRLVRAALPHLRKSDAARIVNIASTEGLGATPGDSPYVVAKTGVIGLTHALAVDLGPEGITVNCICPGPIRTNLTDAIPEISLCLPDDAVRPRGVRNDGVGHRLAGWR